MTTACPDIEELAAFVDGRLSEDARAEMRHHLDGCPRCYEVFVETVRFQSEESLSAASRLGSDRPAQSGGQPPWLVWGTLAAAIIGGLVVVTPFLETAGRGRLTADLPVHVVARHLIAQSEQATAPPFDGDGWSYARSDAGFAVGLDERERSFRLGVRVVDLELALQTAESDRARKMLPEVIDLAESFDAAEHLAYSYGYIEKQLRAGQATHTLLDASRQAAEFLPDVVDGDYFAFGKWAEAGRIAAEAGHVGFFRSKAVRHLHHSFSQLEVPEETTRALTVIGSRLEDKVTVAMLPELASAFAAAISATGNLP